MMSACLQIQTQTNLNEVAEDDGDGVGSVQEDEDLDGAHLGKKKLKMVIVSALSKRMRTWMGPT